MTAEGEIQGTCTVMSQKPISYTESGPTRLSFEPLIISFENNLQVHARMLADVQRRTLAIEQQETQGTNSHPASMLP